MAEKKSPRERGWPQVPEPDIELEPFWWNRERGEHIVTDCKELREAKALLGEGVILDGNS